MRKIHIIVTALWISLNVPSALAQPIPSAGGVGACAGLLRPTEVSYNSSLVQTYAYSEADRNQSHKDSSWSAGIVVPIYGVPVGVNGGQSKKDVEDRLSQLDINWTNDERIGYMVSYVPPEAGVNFNNCVKNIVSAQDGKLTIEASPQSDGSALVSITVHAVGNGGPLFRKVQIWTNGETRDSYREIVPFGGSPIKLLITRPDQSKDLLIKAEVTTITGAPIDSEYLVLPWMPIERPTFYTPDPKGVRCGGNNSSKQLSQDQVIVQAGANEILFPDTVTPGLFKGIPASGGDHPDKFPNGVAHIPPSQDFGIDFSVLTSKIVAGNVWCYVSANENPGVEGSFSVSGKIISKPSSNGRLMTTHLIKARFL